MHRVTWLVMSLAGAGLAIACQASPGAPAPASPAPVAEGPVPTTAIGCLGRIEPGDGVVRIGARSLSGQRSIVHRLLVREGDEVTARQVLAELDVTEQLHATYLLAEARVEVARRRLEQVQAGAKPSEVAAQRAEMERLEVELENARTELRRNEALYDVVAESLLDASRLRVDTLGHAVRQARERLTSLTEVRPVDVDLARAELEAGIREMERARAEYTAILVRSPLDGRVIKVHAWPGEEVGPQGVMELAETAQMYVVAEVVESDIHRVRPGQRARVSSHGLPGTLHGTVEMIGLKVMENTVEPLDPAAFSDARVVEVRIRLDDSAAVAHLIHLRVDVVIES